MLSLTCLLVTEIVMQGKAQMESQLSTQENSEVDLLKVSRTMLEIVAYLEESRYTEKNKCQTAVQHHDDPADPASANTTTQG
jgi:hypothetical protein